VRWAVGTCGNLVLQVAQVKSDANNQSQNSKKLTQVNFKVFICIGWFFQVFWNLIKDDLMAMFKHFHLGRLLFVSLNFGTIALITKQKEVKQIQQYRPICMLNISFKIFTKVLNNRLIGIANKMVRSSQTSFLPRRNILLGVVVLHELYMSCMKRKRMVSSLNLVLKRLGQSKLALFATSVKNEGFLSGVV
jgi:hypothetical protein